MQNPNPLVSIVICTYNRADLLKRAIISAINQTYDHIEIIITDDCSPLDLKPLINECILLSRFPIYFRSNSNNRGACYTRNEGIKIANGELIAGLDDDDEFSKERIEKLVRAYDDNFSFITSNTKVITSSGSYLMFNKPKVINLEDILWFNCVGSQVLVKKDRLLSLGGFDVNLPSAQDADMWTRLIKEFGPGLRINDELFIMHTEHEMPRITTSKKVSVGILAYLEKHKSDMSRPQRIFRELQAKRLSGELKLNDKLKILTSIKLCFFILSRITKRW